MGDSWGRPALEIGCRGKGGPPRDHVQLRDHDSRLDTVDTFTEGPLTKITHLQKFHLVRAEFSYSHSFDMYFLSTFNVPGTVLGTEDSTKQTDKILAVRGLTSSLEGAGRKKATNGYSNHPLGLDLSSSNREHIQSSRNSSDSGVFNSPILQR